MAEDLKFDLCREALPGSFCSRRARIGHDCLHLMLLVLGWLGIGSEYVLDQEQKSGARCGMKVDTIDSR